MDAIGNNVWIADAWVKDSVEPIGSVVRTQDGGLTWRAERLPGDSPLTVHDFSPETAWASGSWLDVNPTFYRTVDADIQWDRVIQVGARDHLDDMCAAGPHDVWGALNGNEAQGRVWHVHVEGNGTPDAKVFTPPELKGYNPEGITCLDARVAWVAAEAERPEQGKPPGVILHTTDGGETWVQQSAPSDVHYWKISFAGTRR